MFKILLLASSLVSATRASAVCVARCARLQRGPGVEFELTTNGIQGDTVLIGNVEFIHANTFAEVKNECEARACLTPPSMFNDVTQGKLVKTIAVQERSRAVINFSEATQCE